MTLLKKLEDSEEGLIGITEQGDRVHLGLPTLYSHLFKYNESSKKEDYISRIEGIQELAKKLDVREDYVFLNTTQIAPSVQWDDSHCFVAYLQFETDKEKAISSRRKGEIK